MSKKNLAGILLAGICLVVFLLNKKNDQTTVSEDVVAEEKMDNNMGSEKISEDISDENANSASSNQDGLSQKALEKNKEPESFSQKIEKFKPVALEKARQEVAENPHVPPPSGLVSVLEIRDLYNLIQSKKDADLFLEKMSHCSSDSSDTTTSVKSTCLKYSRRLLEKYPEMKNQVDKVFSSASSRAVEVEKMVNSK